MVVRWSYQLADLARVIVLVVVIFAAVACQSRTMVEVPIATHTVEPAEPGGVESVIVVDRAGVVVGVAGEWEGERGKGEDGVSLAAGSTFHFRWSGGCGHGAELSIDRVGTSDIRLTLDPSSGPRAATCTPRGFVRRAVVLELVRSFSPDQVTFVDTGQPSGDPPNTARPAQER